MVYYQVIMYNRDDSEKLLALGFFIHFRPGLELDRAEKRRFLQGALQSMKQLGISRAMASMSFRDFDTFAVVTAECCYLMEPPVSAVTLTMHL